MQNLEQQLSAFTNNLGNALPGDERAASVLAKAIMLPSMTPPPRLSVDYSAVPTAVAALRYMFDLEQTAPAATTQTDMVQNGTGTVLLSRDPFHVLAYTNYVATAATITYYFPAYLVAGFTTHQTITSPGGDWRAVPLIPEYAIGQTAIGAQNDVLFSWQDHGRRYIWIEKGYTMNFVSSGTNHPGIGDVIVMYMWHQSAPENVSSNNFNGTATTSISCVSTGWYSFDVVLGNAATYKIGITLTTKATSNLMVYECLPNLMNMSSSLTKVRVTAASLLLSSRAAPLYAAGTVAGAVIPTGCDPFSVFTYNGDAVKNLGALPTLTENVLQKGMHAISKPDSADCFAYKYGFNLTNGVYDGTTVPSPSPPGGWTAVSYRSPQDATGKWPANNFLLTAFFGIEFLPSVLWFPIAPPVVSDGVVRDSMAIVSKIPAFHENPLHLSAILSGIKTAASWAMRWAPTLLNAFSAGKAVHDEIKAVRATPVKEVTIPQIAAAAASATRMIANPSSAVGLVRAPVQLALPSDNYERVLAHELSQLVKKKKNKKKKAKVAKILKRK